MTRRSCLWSLTCAAVWPAAVSAADQKKPPLNDTLRFGLRCRKPEEFAFVDLVTQKVDEGKLPLDVVLSMLQWARKRRPEFPFPYFQEGIKRRAAAIGVEL